LTLNPFYDIIVLTKGKELITMRETFEVEWTYTNALGYYYTERRSFDNATEQQQFAFEKWHESNVCEVRKITETVWRRD
jgi:hypothetical protein